MKLKLTIDLGNDCMTTGNDVSEALAKVSARFAEQIADDLPSTEDAGAILDLNGNLVGSWKFTR